jgi:predicted RNase H-like nuclease
VAGVVGVDGCRGGWVAVAMPGRAGDDVLAAACAVAAQAVLDPTAERLGDPAEGVIWMPARAR